MSNFPRFEIASPVGRFVTGDLTKKSTQDMDGKPKPENKHSWDIGLAVEKAHPDVNNYITQIMQYAQGVYAQDQAVLQRMQRGLVGTKQGGFSWKIKDGDAPNQKGEYNDNTKGCWVFYHSTTQSVKTVNTQNADIPATEIKRGYFVQIYTSVNANGLQGDRAGVYLNPSIVKLIGFGPEITGGISAEQAFGTAAPTYVPAGMSPVPLAPAGGFAVPQQTALQVPGVPGFPGQQPLTMTSPSNPPVNPATGAPVNPLPSFLQGR